MTTFFTFCYQRLSFLSVVEHVVSKAAVFVSSSNAHPQGGEDQRCVTRQNDCVEHYMYCTCNFLSFFLWSFFSDSPCTQLSVLNVPVSQWFSTIVNFLCCCCCFPHKISTPGQSGDLGPKGYEVSQI